MSRKTAQKKGATQKAGGKEKTAKRGEQKGKSQGLKDTKKGVASGGFKKSEGPKNGKKDTKKADFNKKDTQKFDVKNAKTDTGSAKMRKCQIKREKNRHLYKKTLDKPAILRV